MCPWGAPQKVPRLVALRVLPTIVDNDSTNSSQTLFRCVVFFVHIRVCFPANPPLDRSSFGAAFVVAYLMSGWVCQWKPFWIPVEAFKKAFVEEWVF